MRTHEQVKWDFVQQWLDKARKDLAASEVLLKEEFEDYENVGFHSQQAAEKFVKAFLVRHQIEFPNTKIVLKQKRHWRPGCLITTPYFSWTPSPDNEP